MPKKPITKSDKCQMTVQGKNMNEEFERDNKKSEAKKSFHYDAFISYRHAEPDKFVAENLHKQLEAFRPPRSIAKASGKKKIERVFRDREELPLTNNLEQTIVDALANTDWLIVICSPNFHESIMCRKEVETFIKFHGKDNILTVLAEGTAAEVFPKQLLYKTEQRELPNGTIEEVQVPIEPLAADVRGKNHKEILNKMKTEKLRLLAAIFGVQFDELRQRHREQKMKRMVSVLWIVVAFSLMFAAFCGVIALYINGQNRQIAAQAEEIEQQAITLEEQNGMLLKNQAVVMAEHALELLMEDDREGAIKEAVASMTEYEGMTMPYTAEGHMALIASLGCYDAGLYTNARFQLETEGIICEVKVSPDHEKIAALDLNGNLVIWDTTTREKLCEIVMEKESWLQYNSGVFDFVDDHRIVYGGLGGAAYIYDIAQQKNIHTLENEYSISVYADPAGRYIWVNELTDYKVYDADTYEEIAKIHGVNGVMESIVCTDEAGKYYTFAQADAQQQELIWIHLVDAETLTIKHSFSYTKGRGLLYDIYGDTLFIQHSDYLNDAGSTPITLDAYDVVTGTLKWKWKDEGGAIRHMEFPKVESNVMLVAGAWCVYLIDMQSGEVILQADHFESSVVSCNAYGSRNAYQFYQKDGSLMLIDVEEHRVDDLTPYFLCNLENIAMQTETIGGIALVPENSNRVVFYDSVKGPDIKETDAELPLKEHIIYDFQMEEELIEYGVPNPNLVYGGFYNKEETILFISYNDGEFMVYDLVNSEIINSFKAEDTMQYYVGKDINGYTYVDSYSGGYILNEKMEPCGYIAGLEGLSQDGTTLYISSMGNLYEAPVYTTDELLELAEEYLNN